VDVDVDVDIVVLRIGSIDAAGGSLMVLDVFVTANVIAGVTVISKR